MRKIKSKIKTPEQLLAEDLEKKDWTQRDLARVLGCDYSAVNRLCKGRTPLTLFRAFQLSEIFGRDPRDYLYAQIEIDIERAREQSVN